MGIQSKEALEFELFYPIAQMEAKKIAREFGSYFRLYEEEDLVSWAYESEFWKRYTENLGAMRQIIRFAMLRSLSKAQAPNRGITVKTMDLRYGIPYEVARTAGLIDKNQPTGSVDFNRKVPPEELINTKAEDPTRHAMYQEMLDIIENNFDGRDQEILLRRIVEEEQFDVIGEATGLSRNRVLERCKEALAKLRRVTDDGSMAEE